MKRNLIIVTAPSWFFGIEHCRVRTRIFIQPACVYYWTEVQQTSDTGIWGKGKP
jgi:hypothetical protein